MVQKYEETHPSVINRKRERKKKNSSNNWIKMQSEREQKGNQMVESMMQLGSPHSPVLMSRRHED